MKATTKFQMAIVAAVAGAMLTAPAVAFAHQPKIGSQLRATKGASLQVTRIDPAILGALSGSQNSTIGVPPVKPSHKKVRMPVTTIANASESTPTIMVPAKPSTTTTRTVGKPPVRRPRLPFTGGETMPWILGGVAVMAAGGALMVWKRSEA